MNWKTVLTLVVAVGLGFATTKVGRDLVLGARVKPEGVKMAKVVVAQRTMDPGYQLTERDVTAVELPEAATPESHFGEPGDLVGRTLVAPVVRGQALFEGVLAPPGSPAGMEALVPQGMRAVSIEVSESSGMVGLLKPGSRVDVIATIRNGSQSVARTIVENVKVSAVGQKMSRDSKDKDDGTNPTRTVTLVVTPKNAEAIELAGASGRPRLVLRGSQDTAPSDSQGVSESELRGEGAGPVVLASAQVEAAEPKAPATEPSPVAQRGVQIIRGGKESTVYFNEEPAGDGAVADGPRAETPTETK